MGFILVRRPSLCSHLLSRLLSTTTTKFTKPLTAEQQSHRDLILVKGAEAPGFLQGLITNDVNHLSRGNLSIYGMFLNKGGRVLYDAIIYKVPKDDEAFYIDCDNQVSESLIKHMKIFRVRKKIDIEKVPEKKVWVVFTPNDTKSSIVLPKTTSENDVICTDPRLKYLGTRLVLDGQKTINDIEQIFGSEGVQSGGGDSYRLHRYQLGVGEGVQDLAIGKAFPLEANADFLNGVSFSKGCYIGQELTARTHHTGVIRKRFMPLKFSEPLPEVPDLHSVDVLNESGQSVGKMRGYCNGIGLGLLRIEPVLAARTRTVKGIVCDTHKPAWWPQSNDFKTVK